MIHSREVKSVYQRSDGFCECGCGRQFVFGNDYIDGFGPEIHHIYWKSQYKRNDRDEARNLSLLYGPCHKSIHNGKAWELDKRLKQEADLRKPPDERSKKKAFRKAKVNMGTNKYDKKIAQNIRLAGIEYFKEGHDGLTPAQYTYRKQKAFIDTMKKKGKK